VRPTPWIGRREAEGITNAKAMEIDALRVIDTGLDP
jgi:hypothetical protein